MTQQEIQERNKEIALMFGLKRGWWIHQEKPLTDDKKQWCDIEGKTFLGAKVYYDKDLKFHSDWNWLMEAVEFINKTHKDNNPYRDLHYTVGYLLHGGWWEKTKIPERLLSDKTQLFLAVSDFAKLFNNKEL